MGTEAGADQLRRSNNGTGIGARLRGARERKGFTILQAAEKLHVDAKVVESLEAEDFAALGAPVYVRGHLRHYAELVGEPAAELQELYSSAIKTAQPDLTRIPKAQDTGGDPGKLVLPALVVVVGFAVVGSISWVIMLSGEKAPAMQIRPQAISSSSAQSALAGTSTAPQVARAPATLPLRGGTTEKAALVTPPPARSSGEHAKEAGTAASAAAPSAPKMAQLTLKFSADSWVEVYEASGQRLYYDIGAADSVHTMTGAPPLRVVLGNASGVAVEVNGHSAAITNMVHADGSAQFLVSRTGKLARPKPAADGG